jgi:hypothetical protein
VVSKTISSFFVSVDALSLVVAVLVVVEVVVEVGGDGEGGEVVR